tara:strand:- start:60 stop:251 length:192 start_codon:yes stop_codon:yes gene_type:complete
MRQVTTHLLQHLMPVVVMVVMVEVIIPQEMVIMDFQTPEVVVAEEEHLFLLAQTVVMVDQVLS